jgi:hypothetical protein
MPTKFDENDRLKLLQWLMAQNDAKRSTLTSRASIVVAVAGALFTATYFVADKFALKQPGSILPSLVFFCALLTILLALGGLVFALVAIVDVWRPSREILMPKTGALPERLFFRPTDTTARFRYFADYEKAFREATCETFTNSAIAEVFSQTHEFHIRYQHLRMAMKLVLLALVPIAVSLACTCLARLT